MRRIRLIRPSYANVVATLALFAALGGSSYAALAVTGAQVRDGSLTGRDVRNATLTGKDVRDQSLLGRDFKPGQLPAGPAGPQGARGEEGEPGAAGPKGDPGTASLHVVTRKVSVAAGETAFPNAECGPGEKATGGGIEVPNDNVHVLMSTVETLGGDPTPVGWAAGVVNRSGQNGEVFVQAVCAA